MFMLSGFEALFAPQAGVASFDILRTLLADKDSFTEIYQAFCALAALHESLSDEFVTIRGWAGTKRNFLLLKSVRVRLVGFVALHAESEIVAASAIKAEHQFGDGLHAAITAVPEVVAVLQKLLLGCGLCFFSDIPAELVLKVLLQLLSRFQIVMIVSINSNSNRLLLVLLEKLQVDGFVRLDVKFVFLLVNDLIFVVLATEHLRHGLVVDIWDEVSLKLLLHTLQHRFVIEQVSFRQMVSLLDLVKNFLSLQGFELFQLFLLLLEHVLFAVFRALTCQLPYAILAAHCLFFVGIPSVGCDSGGVGLLKAEVVLILVLVHLILSIRVFPIDRLLLLNRFENGIPLNKFRLITRFFFPALVENVVLEELFVVVKLLVFAVEPRHKLSVRNKLHLTTFL